MENIIKKRHPNSLPALMWAASSIPDNVGENKTPSVQYLEDRMKKLEKQLEEKDEEAKRSLRALEQKYNSMKVRSARLVRNDIQIK
jgi:protein QN1